MLGGYSRTFSFSQRQCKIQIPRPPRGNLNEQKMRASSGFQRA